MDVFFTVVIPVIPKPFRMFNYEQDLRRGNYSVVNVAQFKCWLVNLCHMCVCVLISSRMNVVCRKYPSVQECGTLHSCDSCSFESVELKTPTNPLTKSKGHCLSDAHSPVCTRPAALIWIVSSITLIITSFFPSTHSREMNWRLQRAVGTAPLEREHAAWQIIVMILSFLKKMD